MANEITVSTAIACSKNGGSVSGSSSLTQTIAGNAFSQIVQTFVVAAGAPGADAAVELGTTVGATGWRVIKNLSTTISLAVSLAADTTTKRVALLLPGELCICKPNATLYAAGVGGSADAAILAIEI